MLTSLALAGGYDVIMILASVGSVRFRDYFPSSNPAGALAPKLAALRAPCVQKLTRPRRRFSTQDPSR